VNFGQANLLADRDREDALDYMLEVDKTKREHSSERRAKAIHEAQAAKDEVLLEDRYS